MSLRFFFLDVCIFPTTIWTFKVYSLDQQSTAYSVLSAGKARHKGCSTGASRPSEQAVLSATPDEKLFRTWCHQLRRLARRSRPRLVHVLFPGVHFLKAVLEPVKFSTVLLLSLVDTINLD